MRRGARSDLEEGFSVFSLNSDIDLGRAAFGEIYMSPLQGKISMLTLGLRVT
jgi:hypothetical protein